MDVLKNVLSDLIGEYSPIVTTLSDGSENVQVDYGWIAAAIIFIIAFYSILRVVGGLICKK